MAERIVIAYDVQTGAAEREVRDFSRTVEAESRKSVDAANRGAQSVETSTHSMARSFKGAGSAISAANASLVLIGQQGPPALQTLASSAASLVATGFGPMGIALAGATGLVSLIAALGNNSDEAAEAQGRLEAALSRGRDRAEELRLTLAKLRLEQDNLLAGVGGARAGNSFEIQQLQQEGAQIAQALSLLRQMRAAADPNAPDLASFLRSRGALRSLSDQSAFASVGGISVGDSLFTKDVPRAQEALAQRLRDVQKSIDRLNAITEQQVKNEEIKGSQQLATSEAFIRSLTNGPAGPRTGLGIGAGPTLGGNTEWLRAFQQADLDRIAQEERDAAAAERERAATLDARRAVYEQISNGDPTLDGTEAMLRQYRTAAEERARLFQQAELARIDQTARTQAETYTSTLAGTLTTAVQSGDFGSFFASFANATSDALVSAIARGLINATGIEGVAAQLFKGIGGAFAGGIGGASSGTSPQFPEGFSGADIIVDNFKGASARGPEQIVVVMAPDESVADAMANKISAGGALAIVARAQGRGVMAGRLGPRRG